MGSTGLGIALPGSCDCGEVCKSSGQNQPAQDSCPEEVSAKTVFVAQVKMDVQITLLEPHQFPRRLFIYLSGKDLTEAKILLLFFFQQGLSILPQCSQIK